MLVSSWNWLESGSGLIKLANPAARTAFQGQGWRGHKLEVSRTLLGGARASHPGDGEMVRRVQRRGRMSRLEPHSGKVKHETALAKVWECGWCSWWVGSIARQMIASYSLHPTPPFISNVRESSISDERLYWRYLLLYQLRRQGDLKLVWRWSQGSSCESPRRF